MKNEKRKWTEWIRKKGTGDTALAHLVQFAYQFFANSYIQAFLSILGTVVIAIMIGKSYYQIWFWVTAILYAVITFLTTWANKHIRGKIKDTKIFQNTLYGIGAALRSMSIYLQKCEKKLENRNGKGKSKQLLDESDVDFQTAAFTVCEKLRDTLSNKEEKDDVYVTVFQKIKNNDTCYCRMIAYSANYEVTGYNQRYQILPEHNYEFGKVEYHTYVFAKGIQEVTTFHTHELVQQAFCYHVNREERENEIQQYICIPISPARLGVTFLLQVDTNVEGLFGANKTAVDDFAKNTIYPFAQLLHMMYEQSRVLEQLTKK